MKRGLMLALWPSFLVAAAVNALFFTVFDPVDFSLFGPFGLNRLTAYSAGFLLFWALGAASSAFTLFMTFDANQYGPARTEKNEVERSKS